VVLPGKVFLPNEPKVVQCLPEFLKKQESQKSQFKPKSNLIDYNSYRLMVILNFIIE
jgi:hypothetical protein